MFFLKKKFFEHFLLHPIPYKKLIDFQKHGVYNRYNLISH